MCDEIRQPATAEVVLIGAETPGRSNVGTAWELPKLDRMRRLWDAVADRRPKAIHVYYKWGSMREYVEYDGKTYTRYADGQPVWECGPDGVLSSTEEILEHPRNSIMR